MDDRHDKLDLRDGQIKEREAEVARLTVRADRVEAELENQRAALQDSEDAVARERAVLQRRMSELEEKRAVAREQRETEVRDAVEQSGKSRGLLRGGGSSTKAIETLHDSLRQKEVELENLQRRLAEQTAALQRREADLDTYARKLQRTATAPPAGSTRPQDDPPPSGRHSNGAHSQDDDDDDDPTRKRLQFWSR